MSGRSRTSTSSSKSELEAAGRFVHQRAVLNYSNDGYPTGEKVGCWRSRLPRVAVRKSKRNGDGRCYRVRQPSHDSASQTQSIQKQQPQLSQQQQQQQPQRQQQQQQQQELLLQHQQRQEQQRQQEQKQQER